MFRISRRPSILLSVAPLLVFAVIVSTVTSSQAQASVLSVPVGRGWNAISLPYEPVNGDPWELFDELRPPNQTPDLLSGSLHRYDNEKSGYVTYMHQMPDAFGSAVHGEGYWLSASAEVMITYEALAPSVVPSIVLDGDGWHMIGLPRLGEFSLSDVLVTNVANDESKLFADAVAAKWVESPIYRIDRTDAEGSGASYTSLPAPGQPLTDVALDGYAAYWVSQLVDSVILTFDLPPTGLLAQATSATEVDLTWSDNSDYDSGYEVERRAASGSFQRIATLAANATAYTDGNASPSTTYEYRVRGLNAAGFTAYSDITTTTTPPDTAPRPLGSVTAVAADPSRLGYAYAASADVGLIVFDVSAAASPRAVAAAALPVSSQPAGLKVSGDLAVIPARHVVAVYDLGEPTAPVRVATITVPAVDVAIMGDYLYLCDEYNGLVTFDVSDPWNPRQQATVLPVMGYEMDVAGGDIWVAALSELRGVATQPPWSPSLLGFVPTSICQVVCGTPAHAFVFSGAALRVIDVADPLRPLEVGSLTTDAVRLTSLSALNQQVCATWYYQALASRGLWMYDVSDPTRPVLLSNVWTQGGAYDVSAIEVGPHDKRCYVADGTAGFTVVDVTDPTRPRVVGNCRTM